MIENKKIIVVMPAYNAEKTLLKTYEEIPKQIVDEVLVVDDCSSDKTAQIARDLGITVFIHERNKGYGANQKTCYLQALLHGADIVIMLHPDYQYPPRLVTAMASLIASGMFDMVLGSRILGGKALKGGMPLYKYISNRFLTFIENECLRQKLSEYHTGFRAFSRKLLLDLPIMENSDDFIFDNQMIAQAVYFGYDIGEITAPSRYTHDSSSISLWRSVVYGLGVLRTAMQFAVQRIGLSEYPMFSRDGKKLPV